MLDYTLLETLAAVDREGSVEGAARSLHVTPSAVSQRLKLLEERVGTVLVVRGRPCVATPAGQQLCRHVERVALLEREIDRELPALGTRSGRARPAAVLRVAVNADSLSTWFVQAVERFAREGEAVVDVSLDDEGHTADWLRTGRVLAAVTADAEPIQGCRSVVLGRMRYLATASPAFVARHFSDGVTEAALAEAPTLVFDPRDRLQRAWMRRVCRRAPEPPTHRLPSTQAFLDASLAGLAWCMNPELLARPHLEAGRLVELVPGVPIDVPLHWQHPRLAPPILERLTAAVIAAARASLRQRRPRASRAPW
ncbi:MAG TPA: LysR family transcriptional regulator ArgP [Anaeromyxobacter sp.]|nr:LysR family transcriptional regulator ArgP [Anaeromyxobacter sp.]